jgi:FMN-dependent oxidoreductase (nitrilotriacetate monooxygenase family)
LDSLENDAFIRDVQAGIYFNPAKLHELNHKGRNFSVRRPLNVALPVQGWPVYVQAGQSEAGRQLAAEAAEVVFSGLSRKDAAQQFYIAIERRTSAFNRDPAHMKILPGAFVLVGYTPAEANAKKRHLDRLVHLESGFSTLQVQLGGDISAFDLDRPLSDELPPTNGSQTTRQKLVEMSRNEGITVRELAQYVGGAFGTLELIGTLAMIADQMGDWFLSRASDGFNIMFPFFPSGLDDFVDKVIPELQRRGLFRQQYEDQTLCENMGLPRPKKRFILDFSPVQKSSTRSIAQSPTLCEGVKPRAALMIDNYWFRK